MTRKKGYPRNGWGPRPRSNVVGRGHRADAKQLSIHGRIEEITQNLYLSIGYNECNVAMPRLATRRYVLPDALSYIEKLTLGRIDTKRARDLSERDVHNALKAIIPRPYYRLAGMSQTACTKAGFTADQSFTMLAATKYITDLIASRNGRHMNMRGKMEVSKKEVVREEGEISSEVGEDQDHDDRDAAMDGVASATSVQSPLPSTCRSEQIPSALTESEVATDRALKKMEKWTELWLSGDLKGDDWYTFKLCLLIPDALESKAH